MLNVLCQQNRKTKQYPSHIKKLLREKLRFYKKGKSDILLITKYEEKWKYCQKAVKIFNIEHEKSFYKYPYIKFFYSFKKIKDLDRDKASFFNKSFQKVFSKDCEDINSKLIDKNCSEMKNFFMNNDDILKSVNHLKDKIIETPESIPSFFVKRTISSLVIPISLFLNCYLAISSIAYTKPMKNLLCYTNTQKK